MWYDWDDDEVISFSVDGGKTYQDARWKDGQGNYQNTMGKQTYVHFRRASESRAKPPAGRRSTKLPLRPKFKSLLTTPPEYVKIGKAKRDYWERGNKGSFRVRDRKADQ